MKINHTITVQIIAEGDVSPAAILDFVHSRLRLSDGSKFTIKKIGTIAAAREPRPDLVALRERWGKMRYRGLFVREEHGEFVVRVREADPEDPEADLTNVVLRSEIATKAEMEVWATAAEDVTALLRIIDEKDDAPAAP